MSRPVYKLNSSVIDYTRVEGEPMTFDFMVSPEHLRVLKNPRAVVQGSRTDFQVKSLARRPGPVVDGKQPYRMTLEPVS